ncbi:MAG: hypothetical protein V1718_03130 [archaeon]
MYISSEKKYVVLTDTYDDSWTLGASKKLDNHPTNIWEYTGDTEIKKTSGDTGYIISIATLLLIIPRKRK